MNDITLSKAEQAAAATANQHFENELARFKAWQERKRQTVQAFQARVAARRKPGILDRISACPSREAAHLLWHEFLDSSNDVSQKTINKAERLLSTLDFSRSMIPHDILLQIFDHPPVEENIAWNSDVIRVQEVHYHRHFYTRADINLSQGIVYFYRSSAIVLKLALEVKLSLITSVNTFDEGDADIDSDADSPRIKSELHDRDVPIIIDTDA